MTSIGGGRIRSLDGFRAVAATLVFLYHGQTDVFRSGGIGVYMFFVLSGFLITGILLAEHERRGTVGLGHFYIRRALRLYPALVALVLAANLTFRLSVGDYAVFAAQALTYTTNLFMGVGGEIGPIAHTWTLGVEEQFYVIWPPLLVWSLRRISPLRVTVTALAACALLHVVAVVALPESAQYLPVSVFDQTLAGALLAVAVRSEVGRRIVHRAATAAVAWIAAILVGIVTLLPMITGLPNVLRLWLIAACSVVLIGHLATSTTGPLHATLAWRPVVWLGERSYSFYLFHTLVLNEVARQAVHLRPLARLPLAFALSVGAAGLSFALVEGPFLRLKDRLSVTADRSAISR